MQEIDSVQFENNKEKPGKQEGFDVLVDLNLITNTILSVAQAH